MELDDLRLFSGRHCPRARRSGGGIRGPGLSAPGYAWSAVWAVVLSNRLARLDDIRRPFPPWVAAGNASERVWPTFVARSIRALGVRAHCWFRPFASCRSAT